MVFPYLAADFVEQDCFPSVIELSQLKLKDFHDYIGGVFYSQYYNVTCWLVALEYAYIPGSNSKKPSIFQKNWRDSLWYFNLRFITVPVVLLKCPA